MLWATFLLQKVEVYLQPLLRRAPRKLFIKRVLPAVYNLFFCIFVKFYAAVMLLVMFWCSNCYFKCFIFLQNIRYDIQAATDRVPPSPSEIIKSTLSAFNSFMEQLSTKDAKWVIIQCFFCSNSLFITTHCAFCMLAFLLLLLLWHEMYLLTFRRDMT